MSLCFPALICGYSIQISDFSNRIESLYGSQPSTVLFERKTSTFGSELQVSMVSQTSPVVLCMQNCVISTRITSLHGSQTSPVVLCMQNNVIIIRITSLYVSPPSSVVFACKTTFGSELQVAMSPWLRLLICACKTTSLDPEWRLSIGPSLHL